MWIEVKGRQHRVYWRNNLPEPSPRKAYVAFGSREDAASFIGFARWVGLPAARQYLADPSEAAMTALRLQAGATAGPTRNLATPPPHASDTRDDAGPALDLSASLAANPALTGVRFEQLWRKWLEAQRHLEEGTVELYTSYGELHFLPFSPRSTSA